MDGFPLEWSFPFQIQWRIRERRGSRPGAPTVKVEPMDIEEIKASLAQEFGVTAIIEICGTFPHGRSTVVAYTRKTNNEHSRDVIEHRVAVYRPDRTKSSDMVAQCEFC